MPSLGDGIEPPAPEPDYLPSAAELVDPLETTSDQVRAKPWSKRDWSKLRKKTYGSQQAARKRLEWMIRERVLDGEALVQFYVDIFCGRPYAERVTRPIKLNADQEAVARGDATKEQRERCKKLKRYSSFSMRKYPTLAEKMLAAEWLTERGWGKAPNIIEESTGDIQGFVIERRHWSPGQDPLDPQWSRDRLADMRRKMIEANDEAKRSLPAVPGNMRDCSSQRADTNEGKLD